jgi:gliding motility-associated protein GldE
MIKTEPPSQPLNTVIEAGFSESTFVYLAIIAFLLLISALMSGSESAFFSLKPADNDDLKKTNDKQSKLIQNLLSRPKELLATILITNNFVNVGVVILSTFVLDDIFPANPGTELQRFLIEVIGITFLILLTGEVLPKVYATKNAMSVVRFMANPLTFLAKLPPISWIKFGLVHGSFFIQKLSNGGAKVNTDELEQALALTREDSTSEEDHKILEGIVKFGKTEACQIMTPRIEVDAIDNTLNFKEVLEFILESGYSRIPIFEGSQDNVIGILYIKDLLQSLNQDENFDWRKEIRKPYFIPENKRINDLLQDFRSMKMHMAIVVDEYGGASGIVTLEDILEEIVGDITDEFDENEVVFSKIDESTYLFEGRTSLNDFYKIVECNEELFESLKGEAETIGGLIIEQSGRILRNNEFITIENYKLIVESSDKKRIKTVKIKILNHE